MDDKRSRIPAFCLDIFAYSLTSVIKRDGAPLVSVAAALCPPLRADLRERVALALIAGEVNGDLYLIPRSTAWRSVREIARNSTAQPPAANLLFADPFGMQQPTGPPLLFLHDLNVFQFSSEDPHDERGSQARLDGRAKTCAAIMSGSEKPTLPPAPARQALSN
jgi:hypothetical protein